MNEGRGRIPAGKRPPMKEKPREEAHFDRARAVEELKRYLDVCVRGMGLELEYEISSGGAGAQDDGSFAAWRRGGGVPRR